MLLNILLILGVSSIVHSLSVKNNYYVKINNKKLID